MWVGGADKKMLTAGGPASRVASISDSWFWFAPIAPLSVGAAAGTHTLYTEKEIHIQERSSKQDMIYI